VRIPELPPHDAVEKSPAGDGWTAYVALLEGKTVGVVVVPTNRKKVPSRWEPRDLHIGAVTHQAVAKKHGIDVAAADKILRQQARALHAAPSISFSHKAEDEGQSLTFEGNLSLRGLYRWVARFVLIADQLGEPRYRYIRHALEDVIGIDLGDDPEGAVKDYIHRATQAEFLEPARGRGPRRPGRKLEEGVRRVQSVTLEASGGVTYGLSTGRKKGGKR
jgi:hypothetical protein